MAANDRWSKQDFWDQLSAAERFAVFLGNMNYQVQNGGWSQWIGNGYGVPEVADYIERALQRVGTAAASEAYSILKEVRRGGLEEPRDEDEHDDWYAALEPLCDRYYVIDAQLMADCDAYVQKEWPTPTQQGVA